MKWTINRLEQVERKSFSLLRLNLQDVLILDDNVEVIGMIHLGHKTARMFRSSLTIAEIDLWLMEGGFKIQETPAAGFVLSEWTGHGHLTCGAIIYELDEHDKLKG